MGGRKAAGGVSVGAVSQRCSIGMGVYDSWNHTPSPLRGTPPNLGGEFPACGSLLCLEGELNSVAVQVFKLLP